MHTSDAFFGWSRSIRRDGHSVGYTRISLRTVPRNFPGRSGTEEDQVYLCSPETATASALTGKITDPRTLAMAYPNFQEPKTIRLNTAMLAAPAESGEAVTLEKGPNIVSLPLFEPLPDTLEGPVLLKVGDDISTDEIMPAGSRILPYRSNIPKISEFSFSRIDTTYSKRAKQHAVSFVVGGDNYGQGSSREHAALGPRYLGLRAVLAKSYARIHQQNLINFGILPLTFSEPNDWERIAQNDVIAISGMRKALAKGKALTLVNKTKNESYDMEHMLTERSLEMILAGGLINVVRGKQGVE